MLPSHARLWLVPFSDDEAWQKREDFWNDVYGFDFSPILYVSAPGNTLSLFIEVEPEGGIVPFVLVLWKVKQMPFARP